MIKGKSSSFIEAVALAVIAVVLGTGCSTQGFYSVKQDPKVHQTAASNSTKLKVTKEFDPAIVGDSYEIPDTKTGKPQIITDKAHIRLPARTSDGTNISILPPGAKL